MYITISRTINKKITPKDIPKICDSFKIITERRKEGTKISEMNKTK